MNFIQILASCDPDFVSIMKIVRWVINLICWAIPVVLIVLSIVDVAKVVLAGNIDDKMKKEVGNKVLTRVIYAIVIFLIPTIVRLIFRFVPVESSTLNGVTWQDCWDAAASK